MLLPRYPVRVSEDYLSYWFFSEGPKGRVAKGVRYILVGENLYNLGFGDMDEEGQEINDLSRSNNGDRNKILATVAFTALDFIQHYPGAVILVKGSTYARTRLYQMGINRHLAEISQKFKIKGFLGDRYVNFRSFDSYQSFLFQGK